MVRKKKEEQSEILAQIAEQLAPTYYSVVGAVFQDLCKTNLRPLITDPRYGEVTPEDQNQYYDEALGEIDSILNAIILSGFQNKDVAIHGIVLELLAEHSIKPTEVVLEELSRLFVKTCLVLAMEDIVEKIQGLHAELLVEETEYDDNLPRVKRVSVARRLRSPNRKIISTRRMT